LDSVSEILLGASKLIFFSLFKFTIVVLLVLRKTQPNQPKEKNKTEHISEAENQTPKRPINFPHGIQ
jgi:hypothetical protein